MRLWTFFLLVLGAAALAAIGWIIWQATAETREWSRILAASGRALELEDVGRVQSLIRRHLPPSSEFHPWRVLKVDGSGDTYRLLTVHIQGPRAIPSECTLLVHLFDDHHRLRTSFTIEAGWRAWEVDLKTAIRPDINRWGFVVVTDGDIQHYALIEQEPVLVRLEDLSGQLLRNNYEAPNWTIGGRLPARSPEQWEQSLSSEDRAEVLNTMIWLGGVHAPPTPPDPTLYRESFEAAKLFDETRQRPGVRERLQELAQSPDPWISEAARTALVPK